MGCDQVINYMRMILSDSDLGRIDCYAGEDGMIYMELDLHGLSCKQAERFLKNAICVNRGAFVINAIHGFNHGTVIKRMIMKNNLSNRISRRYSPDWNPGQTYLTIAA